jgi:hypothetical protein
LGRLVVAHAGGPGGTCGYTELVALDLDNCAEVPHGDELV